MIHSLSRKGRGSRGVNSTPSPLEGEGWGEGGWEEANVQFQVVNPFDYADWNERLASLGSSSFFNTVQWARVLSASYGYEPCYIVGVNGGDFVSLLPMMHINSWLTGRRGVALPFSDYCEPVVCEADRGKAVEDYLKQLGREKRWRYFEIRNAGDFKIGAPFSATYLTHSLDLTHGEQYLSDKLQSSVRTSIRKARKAGVEVTVSGELDAVRVFYKLNCITRKRHGLPPQPFVFFQNLHQQVLAKGMGDVITAWHKGKAIAASLFCHFGRKALFKYGASDKKFQDLRGSTLVMWEAVRHYACNGYDQLSLGRTEPTNAGLRRFKLGWGAAETEICYTKYDFIRNRYVENINYTSDPGYGLVKMLPLSCSRLIGTLLYKHMA